MRYILPPPPQKKNYLVWDLVNKPITIHLFVQCKQDAQRAVAYFTNKESLNKHRDYDRDK